MTRTQAQLWLAGHRGDPFTLLPPVIPPPLPSVSHPFPLGFPPLFPSSSGRLPGSLPDYWPAGAPKESRAAPERFARHSGPFSVAFSTAFSLAFSTAFNTVFGRADGTTLQEPIRCTRGSPMASAMTSSKSKMQPASWSAMALTANTKLGPNLSSS